MCKNTIESDWPHTTIWRMRLACWIPKATNTHSECVILIAFQRQWLCDRVTLLQIEKNEMGGACSADGGGERRV
jgi:hypothetical protein